MHRGHFVNLCHANVYLILVYNVHIIQVIQINISNKSPIEDCKNEMLESIRRHQHHQNQNLTFTLGF